MQQLTTNRSSLGSSISELEVEDEKFWIVPVTMIVEGVHHGSNGAIYYAANELEESAHKWDGKPITLNHPKDAHGNFISAKGSPDVGFVDGVKFQNGKLTADAWINQALAADRLPQQTLNAMLGGQKVEVSTGLFFDRGPYRGVYGGLQFDCSAVNHNPDHLAILTSEKGACSCDRGCGINANSEPANILPLPIWDWDTKDSTPNDSNGPGLSLLQGASQNPLARTGSVLHIDMEGPGLPIPQWEFK